MLELTNTSPLPKKAEAVQTLLTFPDAMREVINGKKVTKLEWATSEVFLQLKDGFLKIYRDSKYYDLIVSEGDMIGTDWVVVEESN